MLYNIFSSGNFVFFLEIEQEKAILHGDDLSYPNKNCRKISKYLFLLGYHCLYHHYVSTKKIPANLRKVGTGRDRVVFENQKYGLITALHKIRCYFLKRITLAGFPPTRA